MDKHKAGLMLMGAFVTSVALSCLSIKETKESDMSIHIELPEMWEGKLNVRWDGCDSKEDLSLTFSNKEQISGDRIIKKPTCATKKSFNVLILKNEEEREVGRVELPAVGRLGLICESKSTIDSCQVEIQEEGKDLHVKVESSLSQKGENLEAAALSGVEIDTSGSSQGKGWSIAGKAPLGLRMKALTHWQALAWTDDSCERSNEGAHSIKSIMAEVKEGRYDLVIPDRGKNDACGWDLEYIEMILETPHGESSSIIIGGSKEWLEKSAIQEGSPKIKCKEIVEKKWKKIARKLSCEKTTPTSLIDGQEVIVDVEFENRI